MLSTKTEQIDARVSDQEIADCHTYFIAQPYMTPKQLGFFLKHAAQSLLVMKDKNARQTVEAAIDLGIHYYNALKKQYVPYTQERTH